MDGKLAITFVAEGQSLGDNRVGERCPAEHSYQKWSIGK